MHRFVATCRPAGAAGDKARVILPADEKSSCRLLLEVALEAERMVPLHQHLLIHRSMHRVAGGASLAHGFVLEDKRPALRRVTPPACFRFRPVRERATVCGIAAVRIVAITATHLALHHRMVMGQVKLAALVEMALKTSFGRFFRIENGVTGAARLGMKAARPVT